MRLAVVAPLQQRSPFGGATWNEVLEHTGQRLAWTDPAFQLVLHDAAVLGGGGGDSAVAALQASLASSQAAVAISVTDPDAAAALAPLLGAALTALALGSDAALAGATRLGGRHPADAAAAGCLAGLLRRLLPDKQAQTDAQVGGVCGMEARGRGSSAPSCTCRRARHGAL